MFLEESLILPQQQIEPSCSDKDYEMSKKVFQYCDKCGTETRHFLIGLVVRCHVCNHSYTIVEREDIVIKKVARKIKTENIYNKTNFSLFLL